MTDTETNVNGRQQLGELFQQAREAQGMKVTDVSAELKLLSAAVKGLEKGDYQSIKGGVFVKGYIKSYAQFLKLDVDECIRLYQEASATGESACAETDLDQQLRGAFGKKGVVAVAALVLLLLVYSLLSGGDKSVESGSDQNTLAEAASTSSTAPVAIEETVSAELPPVEALTPTEAIEPVIEPVISSANNKTLQLSFTDDCWVEINDANGQRLLSDLKRAGEKVVLTGEPPFEALFGYGHAVSIQYLGQPVLFTVGENPTVKLSIGEKQ